jgi:ABC-2 type transport system permease protein
MSANTATLSPARPAGDLARPSLGRLALVELRKMVDTRAGLWLQITTVGLTLLVVVVSALTGHDQDHTLTSFLNNSVQPASVLLPVVGILLVTSEWSQNTTLITFSLVPRRSRVVVAKVLACLALALTAMALCFVLSLIGTAFAAGGVSGAWHLPLGMAGQILLSLVVSILIGVAFGAVLLSSAPAIVLYFVLPTAWAVLSSLVSWLDDAGRWLDLGRTMSPLGEELLSTTQWARLATSLGLWLVLPLLLGTWRILRSEIK